MKIADIENTIQNSRIKITDHADEEAEADGLTFDEGKIMLPFEKCPVCGGELKEKVVEKILHGGKHAAVLQIKSEVCLHCGERLYAEETVRLFEKIRNKLKRQEISGFDPLGQTFSVDKEWIIKAIQPIANRAG